MDLRICVYSFFLLFPLFLFLLFILCLHHQQFHFIPLMAVDNKTLSHVQMINLALASSPPPPPLLSPLLQPWMIV